jgi:hypothetical protein
MSAQMPSRRIGAVLLALIIVQSVFAGTVSADTGTAVEQEGDIATFTITHHGDSQAKVQVGTRETRYMVNMTVRAGYDDRMKIRMNTHKAGGWTGASASEVFSASGGEITNIERATETLSGPIEPGAYRIYTYTGGELDGIGVLSLQERATNNATVLTAPKTAELDTLDKLKKHSVESDEVANGDYLITKINASGLSGYISDLSDLNQETEGVSLSIYTEEPNVGIDSVEPDSGEFYRSGDEMYLGFDTSDLDVDPGTTYRIDFEIDGDQNPYVSKGETEALTQEVQIEERTINFNEDPIVVDATNNQRIPLSSTVAPGTKFSFELLSESVDNPFVKHGSATVSENGTLAPKFNFNDVNGKTSFEISIRGEDITETGHVGGLPEPDTETETETPAETESGSDTESGTSTNTSTSTGAENTTGSESGENSSDTTSPTQSTDNETTTTNNSTDTEQTSNGTSTNSTQNESAPTPSNPEGGGGSGIPTNIISMGIAVVVVGVIVKVAT